MEKYQSDDRKQKSERAGAENGTEKKVHTMTNREVRILFNEIDSDCSGFVTRTEVLEFFELEGSTIDPDIAKSMRTVFDSMDGFGHGGLSFVEFKDAYRMSIELRIKEAADKKRNNLVSTPAAIDKLFDAIDSNDTKLISVAEIEGHVVLEAALMSEGTKAALQHMVKHARFSKNQISREQFAKVGGWGLCCYDFHRLPFTSHVS